jgi:hypothetical protein
MSHISVSGWKGEGSVDGVDAWRPLPALRVETLQQCQALVSELLTKRIGGRGVAEVSEDGSGLAARGWKAGNNIICGMSKSGAVPNSQGD